MNDPRAKFLLLLLYSIALSTASSLFTTVLLTTLSLSVLFLPLVRKAGKTYLQAFLPSALVLGCITGILQGPVLAFEVICRFGGLLLGAWAFFQTTEAEQVYYVLLWLHLPRSWSFTFSVSQQFLRILAADLAEIRVNLIARGLPLDRPLQRFLALPRFLLPVFVNSFRTAEQLAETLETRGLSHLPRIHPSFTWQKADTGGTLVGVFLVSFSLWFR